LSAVDPTRPDEILANHTIIAELLPTDSLNRRLRAIIDGDVKLIGSSDASDQLFDLRLDPREQRNLIWSNEHQEVARQLKRQLQGLGRSGM